MKILVVGGAGYVGDILWPALEAEHESFCFDRCKVERLGTRSIVGNVSDDAAVREAVKSMDGVIYLAKGESPDSPKPFNDIDEAFNVNVRGAYRFLQAGLEADVSCFVYPSSIGIIRDRPADEPVDESKPPDVWSPYAMTKRLGEHLCAAAATQFPDATVIVLRLMAPRNETDFRRDQKQACGSVVTSIGPNDVRSLFLAAINCSKPGLHILQATGDLQGLRFPNTRATALLDWHPLGG